MRENEHGLVTYDVADGVVVFSSGAGTGGTSNSTVITGDAGAATVVDTLLLPSMAARIVAELDRRGATASLVHDTHPHADHVGGNAAFPNARALAPPATAESVRRLAAEPSLLAGLFPAYADELAGITLRVPEPATGISVRAGVDVLVTGPAHSPADLAVTVGSCDVLVAGDLCFNQATPMALPGHADLAGWAAALDDLIALGPRVVVPGHGPPGGIELLYTTRYWVRAVLAAATEAAEAGPDAVTRATPVDTGPVADWAAPQRTALAVAVAELTGDTSRLPTGIPVASTRQATGPASLVKGSNA
ncbi:MAG: MBL fold metallo-hydrolase [Pseudonocardia sp.]|nr:MBL fold metallo-hydrolase [Pseudonocardia sp.]MBO0892577.1 MBL fold metallo-hydrolase [Acidothermales bacterium]